MTHVTRKEKQLKKKKTASSTGAGRPGWWHSHIKWNIGIVDADMTAKPPSWCHLTCLFRKMQSWQFISSSLVWNIIKFVSFRLIKQSTFIWWRGKKKKIAVATGVRNSYKRIAASRVVSSSKPLLIFCRLCVPLAPVTVITLHTHTLPHTRDLLKVWSVTIISGLIFSSIQPATLDIGTIYKHAHTHS